jgi:hypothetical protein
MQGEEFTFAGDWPPERGEESQMEDAPHEKRLVSAGRMAGYADPIHAGQGN